VAFSQSASEQIKFLTMKIGSLPQVATFQLEVLPKATFNKQQDEAEFYKTFFSAVIHWATDLEQIVQNADQIACTYGLAAMDALHVAAALQIKADQLITTEKPTKPMHRVTEIQIISI
jgi:predicted nucleic acid-binding protein